MKIEPKRIKSTLAVLIAFLLVVYPIYFEYNDIIEIDFLSPFISFENPDQENLLSDKLNKIKLFAQGFSSAISFACLFSTEASRTFLPAFYSLDKLTSPLRC